MAKSFLAAETKILECIRIFIIAEAWIGLFCCCDQIYVVAWCQIVSLSDILWGCIYVSS